MKDTNLIELRPNLNIKTEASSPMEVFQNITLRPILKLQHETTLALIENSTHYIKAIKKIDKSNPDILNEFIKKFISDSNRLRQTIVGTIIGMMTQKELEFYFNNSSEVNKRIVSMQVKRYADALQGNNFH